jgi:penicillin-binding protein-related factor A (putative recombinase)
MSKQGGRKAHSNGADFEKYLEDVVFKAALDSGYFKRIDKLNPTYVAVRNRAGVTFQPTKCSAADWIALGGNHCTWNYIAIEAKHTNAQSLALSDIKPAQIDHLNAAEDAGQLGLLLVRFEVFTYACRWSNLLFTSSGSGFSIKRANLPHRTEIAGDRTLADILNTWPRTA